MLDPQGRHFELLFLCLSMPDDPRSYRPEDLSVSQLSSEERDRLQKPYISYTKQMPYPDSTMKQLLMLEELARKQWARHSLRLEEAKRLGYYTSFQAQTRALVSFSLGTNVLSDLIEQEMFSEYNHQGFNKNKLASNKIAWILDLQFPDGGTIFGERVREVEIGHYREVYKEALRMSRIFGHLIGTSDILSLAQDPEFIDLLANEKLQRSRIFSRYDVVKRFSEIANLLPTWRYQIIDKYGDEP
jgi:hypothetical protein